MRLAYILATICFMSCSNLKKSEKIKKLNTSGSIKVMSYNIHIANPPSKEAGFVDMDAIANTINRVQPDLVALQEVDCYTIRSGKKLNQAKSLAEKTGMNYYFAKALDRSGGEYGVAILSKFPIIRSEKHSLAGAVGQPSELRTVGLVEVKLQSGMKILFGSLHLDHLTNESRSAQIDEMAVFLEKYSNRMVILGGDFNMLPENNLWDKINTKFFRACAICPYTFPAKNADKTIDYFILNNLASSIFKIKSYQEEQEKYASDHLPIIMEIEPSID